MQPVTLCGAAAQGESHGLPGPVPTLPRTPWAHGEREASREELRGQNASSTVIPEDLRWAGCVWLG